MSRSLFFLPGGAGRVEGVSSVTPGVGLGVVGMISEAGLEAAVMDSVGLVGLSSVVVIRDAWSFLDVIGVKVSLVGPGSVVVDSLYGPSVGSSVCSVVTGSKGGNVPSE